MQTDIPNTIWVVYGILNSGEKVVLAAFTLLDSAKTYVQTCNNPISYDSHGIPVKSPAEILGISTFIDKLHVNA